MTTPTQNNGILDSAKGQAANYVNCAKLHICLSPSHKLRRVFSRQPRLGPGAFTMVEIMATMVIIGIAAAVVIPSIADTTDTQVVAAARTIAADIQYAQNLAITTQADVYVVFTNSEKSYCLSNSANASSAIISPITSKAYSVVFGVNNGFSGLDSMTANFNNSQAMHFDLLGAPHGDGTVRVVAGPHAYVVTVAPATGKITVASTGL